MPRARIYGYLAVVVSLLLGALFFRFAFCGALCGIAPSCGASYFAIAVPIAFAGLTVLGAGFWIGWTILTIKVAPPMPEIVEKRDFAKIKAFLLCLVTLALAGALLYGIYLRSYWALAIPAAVITLVILGMVFWVGIAIITTRATLPKEKGN